MPNFHSTFLSNHDSQPLLTWYGALARGPTCRLLNSGPLVIYFLFPNLVHFLPQLDMVHNVCYIFLSNHYSHLQEIGYVASSNGPAHCFLNSGHPVIYFLFLNLVYFWTLHLGIVGVYSVSRNSHISRLKEFVDFNSKFDENDRKLSIWVENTVGKGEIARYEQFLLFPLCFQKTCTADT